MVVVSYSGKEINAKLVYYGPGLCGKTTNLEHVYDSIPSNNRGKMVSMKTRTERTLFFDFLPVDLGEMGGFKTRFLLYTVPGQVYYNATRKLVLRGVDAVVFVADSARGKMNENIESLENLKENLREYGLDLNTMPWVLQFNKRDLPDTYTIEEMNQALNPGNVPWFEAVATNGTGVFDTLKGVSKLLLEKLSREIKLTPKADSSVARAAAEARKAPATEPKGAPANAGPAPTPSAESPRAASPAPVAAPALPKGVAAAGPPPSSGSPKESRGRHAAPSLAEVTPLPMPAAASPGSKPSFGQKLARLFGRKPAPEPMLEPSRNLGMAEPPVAAPAPPRNAVVTGTGTTRLSRVEPPAPRAAAGTVEKKISVPVTVELTPEEAQSGARLRLVIEIDLATNEARVERDVRTGTR